MVVSGGHSSLFRCTSAIDFTLLGGTIDDAAGEAFDKVASLLGLPYPGGPAIEKVAVQGNSRAYSFPRAFLNEPERIAFSFSGLKTAVRYQIAPPGSQPQSQTLSPQKVADLAASFQEAVIDCLIDKAMRAMEKTGLSTLAVGGGVAANSRFREQLEAICAKRKIRLFIAPRHLCTDNAVMGAIALERLRAGLTEPLSLDIRPGLVR
jgi:N6-L-threonylcarbamoyladenine synthase